MEPSTAHECEIAMHVESFANRSNLSVESVVDIAARLSFIAKVSEYEFLVKYILWRLDQPRSASEP